MRLLKFLWWTCVTLICGVLLSFSGAYLYLSPSLPSVEALRNVQLQIPLKVYSEDGKLISEFGEMRRTPIRFADIPQDFIHALLSAEDDNFSGAYLYLSPSLPSVEALRNVQLQIPLKVYSEDGKLISEFGEMRRTPIRFADIPQDFIHALLSAEDDNFANHYGVDVKSLMRALTLSFSWKSESTHAPAEVPVVDLRHPDLWSAAQFQRRLSLSESQPALGGSSA